MGKEFGKLTRMVGITYYTLSPYEQRAFAGAINPGLKNVLRRCRENTFLFLLPFAICYTTITMANELYEKSIRKNPEDYADDK